LCTSNHSCSCGHQSYYVSSLAQGRILVNDQKVDASYIIKNEDILAHTVHRHEPAVAVYSNEAPFIKVVEETDDVLVIDKPGTLPIHACGGYHIQSLVNLLEPHFGKLYTIHRLDRLTSGLVVLGKSSQKAQEWGKCIMRRDCQKVYFARVTGKFPLNCPSSLISKISRTVPVNGEWEGQGAATEAPYVAARRRNAYGYWSVDMSEKVRDDATLQQIFDSQWDYESWLKPTQDADQEANMLWLNLAAPTRVANKKDGICEAGSFENLDPETYMKTVKPAHTSFGVVQYDADTDSTIVLCRPTTGRSHQIRLHLQHLGHPIANDPNYGGEMFYGNLEGKQAAEIALEKLNIINEANRNEIDSVSKERYFAATSSAVIDMPATEEEVQQGISSAIQEEKECMNDFIKRTCVWCARCRIGGTDRETFEFLIRSSGIWLHALQYTFPRLEGGSVTFRTAPPPWQNLCSEITH
jgi:23S rRNA-/tRNA-specific pseudouridylate synthase